MRDTDIGIGGRALSAFRRRQSISKTTEGNDNMDLWKILLIVAGVLSVGTVLRLLAKSDDPLRSTVRWIIRSEALLLVLHVLGLIIKMEIPLSPATVIWSAVTGMPGTLALVGFQLLVL